MTIPYRCSAQPLLRNRDRIEAEFRISIRPVRGGWSQEERAGYRAELNALGEAAVNQWALGLTVADDCQDQSAYTTLANQLIGIKSPTFTVESVTVVRLTPLSPPHPALSDHQSRLNNMIQDLNDTQDTVAGVKEWLRRSEAENPDLWADKDAKDILKGAAEHLIESLQEQFVNRRHNRWSR